MKSVNSSIISLIQINMFVKSDLIYGRFVLSWHKIARVRFDQYRVVYELTTRY